MAQAQKKPTTICEAAVIAMCFNKDMSQMAFSPNNNLIHIVAVKAAGDCSTWPILHTLEAHDQAVTAIDWNHATGKILSCAHDRAAFVWSHVAGAGAGADGQWEPALIVLDAQMKRGFTAACWCTSGSKVYIACASANVAIGKYDAESDWWRCTVVQPHTSGITAMAAHPTNDTLCATGAADCNVKIFSTFNKSVDGAENRLAKCGLDLAAFVLRGWINALAWAPSGLALVAATQDSRVAVFTGDHPAKFDDWHMTVVNLNHLPLRCVAFTGEDSFVGGGHDFYPVTFGRTADDAAQFAATSTGASSSKDGKAEELSAAAAARKRFQNQASFGQQASVEIPKTKHTNTVVGVRPAAAIGGGALFATASLDGRVEFWTKPELSAI
jgi:actin related protein 2/3 complex subunit 1A/1B